MKAFYEQDANLDFLKTRPLPLSVTAARAMRMPRICVIPA